MLGKLGFAAAAGMAISTASYASPPEPVRVGIIDVHADRLVFSDSGAKINYREFIPEGMKSARWSTKGGFDHGQGVASAFVEQVRLIDKETPVEVFSANPMFEKPGSDRIYTQNRSRNPMIRIDYQGAIKALNWFKENNIKIVLTTMNGADNQGMRSFMAESERLGMVVFASAGNDREAGRVFPAAYDQSIAVAADNRGLALAHNPEVSTWVEFAMDGSFSRGPMGMQDLKGSSFAVAKAAAFAAYAVAQGEAATRENIVAVLSDVSAPRQYKVSGEKVTVAYIDEKEGAKALRSRDQDQDVTIAAAFLQAGRQAGR